MRHSLAKVFARSWLLSMGSLAQNTPETTAFKNWYKWEPIGPLVEILHFHSTTNRFPVWINFKMQFVQAYSWLPFRIDKNLKRANTVSATPHPGSKVARVVKNHPVDIKSYHLNCPSIFSSLYIERDALNSFYFLPNTRMERSGCISVSWSLIKLAWANYFFFGKTSTKEWSS